MSFIISDTSAKAYLPGFFLDREECTRKTREIPQSLATTVNGKKYVKCGTPYPANNNTCTGIVFEDVDVTSGNMPGSVVTKGDVIESRLPVTLDSNAKTALIALGFKFVTEPSVTRPDDPTD